MPKFIFPCKLLVPSGFVKTLKDQVSFCITVRGEIGREKDPHCLSTVMNSIINLELYCLFIERLTRRIKFIMFQKLYYLIKVKHFNVNTDNSVKCDIAWSTFTMLPEQ